jgi:predicted nucleotidyltransferase
VELDPLTPFATVHLKQELETLLQRPVDLVRLRERMNPPCVRPSCGRASARERCPPQ